MFCRLPFLLLIALVGGCMSMSSPSPLVIPPKEAVTKIAIYEGHGSQRAQRTVTAPSDIAKIMDSLVAVNGSMRESWHTDASPQVTVQIHANAGSLIVFAGPGWIGGRENGQVRLRMRNLSAAKQAQFFSALGISFSPKQP